MIQTFQCQVSGIGNVLLTTAVRLRRTTVAVISFLAETIAQATRRPHEPWELAQTLLTAANAGDPPASARGVSGLSVCCLRNARKVAASSRMAAEARSAICAFVSGAFLPQDFRVIKLSLITLNMASGCSFCCCT